MARRHLLHETFTWAAIGAFYEVYNNLGFGFLGDVYMLALERELRARGHKVEREVLVTIFYKRLPLKRQRLDMIVDDKLVVEGKSTYDLKKDATRQLYNYLHATVFNVGLFLPFWARAKILSPDLYALRRQFAQFARFPSNPRRIQKSMPNYEARAERNNFHRTLP